MEEKFRGNRNRRIITGLLAIAILPLLAITAFYSGTHVTNVPGGSIGFSNVPAQSYVVSTTTYYSTSSNSTITQTHIFTIQTITLPGILPVNLPLGTIAAGAELALVISMAVVLGLVFKALRSPSKTPKRVIAKSQTVVVDRSQVADILDKTIQQIKSGLSYRDAVIECYRAISEILEDRTGVEGKTLTAREFENNVSTILRLESPYLHELTQLFELAKYSLQQITEDEANQAVRSLESLSRILRDQPLPSTSYASTNTVNQTGDSL
jgi:Domain of unknown function (DUF4129)